MRLTSCALRCFAMLLPALSGCSLLSRDQALPDPTIPHQVAQAASLHVWVRRPDGTLLEQQIRVEPGWWIASPEVLVAPSH